MVFVCILKTLISELLICSTYLITGMVTRFEMKNQIRAHVTPKALIICASYFAVIGIRE